MIINILTITALTIASYIDLKTREIPDLLSFLLFTTGTTTLIITLIYNPQINTVINYLTTLTIFTTISLLLYYTKQWGGGDAKLLIGLGAVIATQTTNLNSLNYLIWFVISTIIYTLTANTYLYIKNLKTTKKETMKIWKKTIKLRIILYIITTTTMILHLTTDINKLLTILILQIMTITTIIYLLLILSKTIQKILEQKINVTQLTEGDWVTQTIKIKGKTIYNPKKDLCINKKQLNQIKKNYKQKIKVKYGIPLAPAFLMAYLAQAINPTILTTIINII